MKTLLTWFIIFVLWFVVWAWAGFKILEWFSTELLLDAWDNSYQQFQEAYPGSTAQQQLSQKIEDQKQVLMENIKSWLKEQLMSMISFWEETENSENN